MILIQLILIVAILIVIFRFLAYRDSFKTQAYKKILLLLLAIAAIIVILEPNLLDNIAHFVGVGRGADLLLYALTVAFIFDQFNDYVKDKEEQRRIVKIARKIAINEALKTTKKSDE